VCVCVCVFNFQPTDVKITLNLFFRKAEIHYSNILLNGNLVWFILYGECGIILYWRVYIVCTQCVWGNFRLNCSDYMMLVFLYRFMFV